MKITKIIQVLFFGVSIIMFSSCGDESSAKSGDTKPVAEDDTKDSSKASVSTTNDETSSTNTKDEKPLNLKYDARKLGKEKPQEQTTIENSRKILEEAKDELTGDYTGSFGSNKITLTLFNFDEEAKQFSGYSVCAGNYRKLTGTIEENPGSYLYTASEPGDDKYDGKFEFNIDKKTGEIKGKWSPFKKGVVAPKEFTIKKTKFEFNPTAGIYKKTSTELISEDYVSDYGPTELRIMRNEIYARHGYSFKNKEMRGHFDIQEWYIPINIDAREQLTNIELQNIDMILRYEQYWEDSMDDYGR